MTIYDEGSDDVEERDHRERLGDEASARAVPNGPVAVEHDDDRGVDDAEERDEEERDEEERDRRERQSDDEERHPDDEERNQSEAEEGGGGWLGAVFALGVLGLVAVGARQDRSSRQPLP